MDVHWPKGWEWLGAPIGMVGALLLGVPVTFWGLLGLQAFDVISGVLAAIRSSEPLSGTVMRNGLIAKTQVWMVLGATWLLGLIAPEQLKEFGVLPAAVLAGAFATAEFLSVLRNAVRGGAWVPDMLRRVLEPGRQ